MAAPLRRCERAAQAIGRPIPVMPLSKGCAVANCRANAFLHYLKQDYVFLVHFSRAWSMGVVKSETLEEMKVCAGTVDALVNHEMALHVQTCAEAGIDEETLFATREEIENLAYTRFVLDAGLQGDFLDLVAALAPCCFGYAEIGLRLAEEAAEGTPYTRTGSPPIQVLSSKRPCRRLEPCLTPQSSGALGPDFLNSPRWAALQDRFTTATRLEVGFWDMGLRPA